MSGRTAFVQGVALWAPTLPGWPVARPALRGDGAAADPPVARPVPTLLGAAERRRAPDSVAVALEVASAAVAASGESAAELPSVFASAHGDIATTDFMCRTLAATPELISPTRFLHSVHNAAAGVWGIATGCMQPSSAISAFETSFAAGLLEALVQCAADDRPVLLVGYDVAACGAIASTNASRGLLGVALVLAPRRDARSCATLDWSLAGVAADPPPLRSTAAQALAANAMAPALPLFEALARADTAPLVLPLGPALALRLGLRDVA